MRVVVVSMYSSEHLHRALSPWINALFLLEILCSFVGLTIKAVANISKHQTNNTNVKANCCPETSGSVTSLLNTPVDPNGGVST